MSITDLIHDIPIYDVISRYVALTKSGSNYKACCPIHQEKTASFHVFTRTNTFKCFGCNEGGDVISFVMSLKNCSFIEACRIIAEDHHLDFDGKEHTAQSDPLREKRKLLQSILSAAKDFYVSCLHAPMYKHALDYALTRWDLGTIRFWNIGFAPDSFNATFNYLLSRGYNKEDIKEASLASSKGSHFFDYYRNRIMIPLCDEHGKVISFTGRTIADVGENNPKYMHGRNSDAVFRKSQVFFGMDVAVHSIRKQKSAIIVEGPTDVIRLQSRKVNNVIGVIGSSLTDPQAEWLARNCTQVTIVGDSDEPGQVAVGRNAEKLISHGLFVNIVKLPGPEKHDPDSFFAQRDYHEYEKENLQDYIVYYILSKNPDRLNAQSRHALILHVCSLIFNYSASQIEVYIEQFSKILKPKKLWQDEIKRLNRVNEPPAEIRESDMIPTHVNINDFERFGFYEDRNQYIFRTKNGLARGSNFVMEPLFHVESIVDAKRLFKITNEYNYSKVVELQQRDLISLSAFKLRIESMGNFLWEAGEIELNKLKRYLYEKTQSCLEVKQLGWQKEQVWAWSNGIYNGSFSKVNNYGIVPHKDVSFYIPAYSSIYSHEDSLFVSEKRFIHKPGKVSMKELVGMLVKVFGENALIGYSFLLATCFRDVIAGRFGFFPLLNLFGPKGAGKTEMAEAFLQFFGNQRRGPNINNTSKAALADHVAQYSNALCHIDEYKNNLDFEKIEFLKGLHDGTGRTKMNMDRDKKKETTHVDCGVMLTGQEMPTADIALFNRCLFLLFIQTEYTGQQKKEFNDLKDLLKKGITHLTHEILNQRPHFIEHFFYEYDVVSKDFLAGLNNEVIEDRTFRNWVLVVAAFKCVSAMVDCGYHYDQVKELAVHLMVRQNAETKRTSDVAVFWDIFSFLVKEGELTEGVDFKVLVRHSLPTVSGLLSFDAPVSVLYLNHTRVFQKYRKHGAQTRDVVLPVKTLEYYLSNSNEFYGRINSVSFVLKQGMESEMDARGKVRRQVTSAMAFNYHRLTGSFNVNVTLSEVTADNDNDLPY